MSVSMITKIVRLLERKIQKLKQLRRQQAPIGWDFYTQAMNRHQRQVEYYREQYTRNKHK
jgi:hypothetical protein